MVVTETASQKTIDLITRVLRNPHLWVVAFMLTLLSVIHYHNVFANLSILKQITSVLELGLSRHTLVRILFLIPVAYGGATLGVRGGLSILALVMAIMFPRAFFISTAPREALFETGGIIFTGALVVTLLYALQKGKQQFIELKTTQRMLDENSKLQKEILRRNRELLALNHISHALSQSLDLEVILQAVANTMVDALEVQVSWVQMLDDTSGLPAAQASDGVSADTLDRLLETVSGIASSEQIETSSSYSVALGDGTDNCDQTLWHFAVTSLKSKGIAFGTAGIATAERPVDQQCIQLLGVIGEQVAGAIERCKLYEEVQLARDVRGELLHKVITAQEEERRRIARELHDETGQALTALRLGMERLALGPTSNAEEFKEQLCQYLNLCQRAEEDIDKLILDLRPTLLDDLGLVEAIRFYTDTRLKTAGVHATVRVTGKERKLPGQIEAALFRIMQEGIANIAKYAHATNATVYLSYETSQLVLRIEDDGCGFETSQLLSPQNPRRGLGLLGMRERITLIGGTLNITSRPRMGSRIEAIVTIPKEEY